MSGDGCPASADRSRALVLGGGGPVGRAFHWGLAAGFLDAGIDLRDADLIVGTSAGAIVGAQFGLGADPRDGPPAVEASAAPGPSASGAAVLQALLADCARAVTSANPEGEWKAIGAKALGADGMSEAESLSRPALLPFIDQAWPANFRATTVDAHSGRFRLWRPDDGAPLSHVIAASSALPGVWPPITVGDSRYIDGGVRSMLNADLAQGYTRVLAISCFDISTLPGLPEPIRILNDALREEIDRVRSSGSVLEFLSPDAEILALTGYGTRMLDTSLVPETYALARSMAGRESDRILALWSI